MRELWIDIETYSDVDLKKSNVYRYTESPEFDIMMAAWAIDDGPVEIAIGFDEIFIIPGLWDPKVLKIAHNAPFERICFTWMGRRMLECEQNGYLNPAWWDDTMILAAEAGYPHGLDALAKALGAEQKDTAGTRLISLFCKPNRKGLRNRPEDFPEEWEEFKRYCKQDVATMRDVRRRLPDWPPGERERWLADQAINDAGIPVDVAMARAAVETADRNAKAAIEEIRSIAGIENPNSGPQMIAWLREELPGVDVPNLTAATVTALLDRPDYRVGPDGKFIKGATGIQPNDGITPKARRVLELRQEIALVAAKKYGAALDRVSEDDRLRGAFQFYGAHTGRFAGRGVQLQNLPSATMGNKDDPFDLVEHKILAGVLDLKLGLGATPQELKALVRAMFVGPFTVVDYAAIEARVIAWLAGEQWALDAFALGRDIYVETAERMGGLTRKEGKVAVLALGYQGGVNSLRIMGAQGDDKHLAYLRDQWREANPAIVDLWSDVEDAFRYGDRAAGGLLHIHKERADRFIELPSGRTLSYHDLKGKVIEGPFGPVQQITFADPKGMRTGTYGGRLTENITQAVARDILADALVNLQKAGHEVVGHVHDEVLVLGNALEDVTEVMVTPPSWAAGLPISAEGFVCARYRKD